jgi:PAS domain S-box-containing protein
MNPELKLLIIEDSEDDAELVVRELKRGGLNVVHRRVDTEETLTGALRDARWDLIIADYTMPRFSGTEALALVRAHSLDVPFVFVSGTIGEDTAIAALKAGAQDYLVKGNTKRLVPAVERELREAEARRERQRLEKERRAAESRYRQVLTIAADGIVVADTGLTISIFNHGAELIFGYPADTMVGRSLDFLFPAHSAESARRRIIGFLTSEEPEGTGHRDEFVAKRADGTEFPIEVTVSRLGENGRTTATIVIRDVSERKRAEKKLRQLSRAVEQSANLVVIADVDGRIEYVNPRFLAATGYRLVDVIGRRPFFWSRPDEGAGLADAIWQTVLTGRDWRGEFENLRREGAPLTVSATISPVTDESGAISHVIAIEEDITRRREVELQLQQAQKMEAIGLLTGGVAHDFNNLLAIIIGNLDLLSSQLSGDDESQTSIQLAMAAGLRGADLTRQLLAFARQQPLSPRVFDLNRLVGETVTMLGRIIGEKVVIRTELMPGLWAIEADTTQVETTLANLAINARDAMPAGGELVISTVNRAVGGPEGTMVAGVAPGDYVVLSVADSGVGIGPDIIKRVCEPFFTTKPPGKGTGLGLSMAYGFARQSGGNLLIDSKVGEGTTVSVYLPRAAAANRQASLPSDADAVPLASAATILVVEDNADVRHIVVRQLRDLGYEVIEVDNAAAAREVLQSDRAIDLVFSDMVLPGGTGGQELAREARRIRPGIRIILTSGYASATANGGVGEPGVAFIGKPYRRADLARKIHAVLEAPVGSTRR